MTNGALPGGHTLKLKLVQYICTTFILIDATSMTYIIDDPTSRFNIQFCYKMLNPSSISF